MAVGPPEVKQNVDPDTDVVTVGHWVPATYLMHGLRLEFELDAGELSPLMLKSWHFFDAGVSISRIVVDTESAQFELPETLVGTHRWTYRGQAGKSVIESLRVAITRPDEMAAVRRLASAQSARLLLQGSGGNHVLTLYPRQLQSMRLLLERYDELAGNRRP